MRIFKLSDPKDGEGAGSADLYRAMQKFDELLKTPLQSLDGTLEHFEEDVLPFIYCCRMSSNCETYFKNRPSRDSNAQQAGEGSDPDSEKPNKQPEKPETEKPEPKKPEPEEPEPAKREHAGQGKGF